MHQTIKSLILSSLPNYIMGDKAVAIVNIFKNSGGSLPPLLIIFFWLFLSFVLYPPQSQKVQVPVTTTGKQQKIKKPFAKIPSQKKNTNYHTYAYSIQTPTPTYIQFSPSHQEVGNTKINTIPSITPTQVPATGSNLHSNTDQKPNASQQAITPAQTIPVENISKPPVENQNQNQNNNLSGISNSVNKIVPAAVSLLGSNSIVSTKAQ